MKLKKVLNRLLDTVGIGIRDAFIQVCGKMLILLPCDDENFFVLRLESDFGISEYKLKYEPNIERIKRRTLNL